MKLAKYMIFTSGLFVIVFLINIDYCLTKQKEKIVDIINLRYPIELHYEQMEQDSTLDDPEENKKLIQEIKLVFEEIHFVNPLNYIYAEPSSIGAERYFIFFSRTMTREQVKIEDNADDMLMFFRLNLLIFSGLFIFFLLLVLSVNIINRIRTRAKSLNGTHS